MIDARSGVRGAMSGERDAHSRARGVSFADRDASHGHPGVISC
jgi:hypothetical protein